MVESSSMVSSTGFHGRTCGGRITGLFEPGPPPVHAKVDLMVPFAGSELTFRRATAESRVARMVSSIGAVRRTVQEEIDQAQFKLFDSKKQLRVAGEQCRCININKSKSKL
ncbi:hypothetical protein HPP92_010412 [Vanilla planifolia]|uniref:Uncharacterized protein n=1 Tax=Vanilla planifolia TaxID=51239 RepID=A0A835QVL8_VANPL|nr:hypothetical protein HPP92_010412 [Vanilla planifolia]